MATVSVFALLLVAGLATSLYIQEAAAVKFNIKNQCGYTVWPAGLPGGGKQLDKEQTWGVDVPAGTKNARFWGRTGCSFDGSGKGSCQTGDCRGQLSCSVSGAVPATVVEYSLNGDGNKDFYDVSLVDGFNVPLSINPTSTQCKTTACKADVNAACPSKLKVTGGCKSACAAFKTEQYCCTGSYATTCPATKYSMIFKQQCPQAYSYAKDDTTSTSTCPSGTTGYNIVFCP